MLQLSSFYYSGLDLASTILGLIWGFFQHVICRGLDKMISGIGAQKNFLIVLQPAPGHGETRPLARTLKLQASEMLCLLLYWKPHFKRERLA